MNRKSFIANTLLAICSTLLPEILRPMEGVVKEESKVDKIYDFVKEYYETGNFYYTGNKNGITFRSENNGKWKLIRQYTYDSKV